MQGATVQGATLKNGVGRLGGTCLHEELAHGKGDLLEVCFQREVPCIQKLNLRARNISAKSFRAGRNEIGIALTPNRQERGLRLPEILLKSRVKLHVVGVVEKEVQLNVGVAGAGHERGVEGVAFGSDQVRVCNARGIFPAHSLQIQDFAN